MVVILLDLPCMWSAEAHGGTICTDLATATVAVLQHQQQASYGLSRSLGFRAVSWGWVVRSAYARTLLPYEDQVCCTIQA